MRQRLDSILRTAIAVVVTPLPVDLGPDLSVTGSLATILWLAAFGAKASA